MRRERGADQGTAKAVAKRRTVSDLVRAAEQVAGERQLIAADKAAKEKARQEHEAARARAKYLAQLAGREPMIWEKVKGLIATKQPKS